MQNGNFYFISEEYFEKFEGNSLMSNKETDRDGSHGRPCYYAFRDKSSEIMWMIPISSQLEKYEKIYNAQSKRYTSYDGIRFGYVLGKKKAFLIQNICPIIDKYIANEYIDNTILRPVTIKESLKSELNAAARKAVRLYRQGTKIVFPNILEIEKSLLDELVHKNINVQEQLNAEVYPND